MTGHASTHTDPVADRLARIGRSPNLLIIAGALSVVIGLLVLSWPGATIAVVAWLFAIQLLVTGVLQVVSAFSAGDGAGRRVMLVLLGALSILVGLLCLRAPLQTALVLGLLIGAMWVIQGVITVGTAIGSERGAARGWMIASGVLSVLGGAVVLVYPGASLVVLVWMLGIFLIVSGAVLVIQGVVARRPAAPARQSTAGQAGSTAPSPS
jgi:uncharacterized membrane protein HdeD (DUF308 family)